MRIGICFLLAIGLFSVSVAKADVLCVKNAVKANKKGKVNLKTAIKSFEGSTCPGGHSLITDTTVFQGPRGYSSWDLLPTGQTIVNRITVMNKVDFVGMHNISANGFFPAPGSFILDDDRVILKLTKEVHDACPDLSKCLFTPTRNTALAKSSMCKGTFEIPTAPPGYVCVYPSVFKNVFLFWLQGLSRVQFFMQWGYWGGDNNGYTDVDLAWAYTEPLTRAVEIGPRHSNPFSLRESFLKGSPKEDWINSLQSISR